MATPPRPSRAEVEKAIGRIHWRHRRVDDPRRSELGIEPRDVLEYLTRYSAHLPRWVVIEDTLDALVLSTWLWWEDRRRERALLRRGVRMGLTHGELGIPLGIATRQGLRDRLDRLEALLAFDRPDEKLSRSARRETRAADARQQWLDARRARIRDVLTALVAQAARLATDSNKDGRVSVATRDEEEWVSELRADLDDEQITPATLALLGLALGPLRIAARRAALPPSHGLHRAIRAADSLRADFARAHRDGRVPKPASPS